MRILSKSEISSGIKFTYRYRDGAFYSIYKTAELDPEQTPPVSKPHDLLKYEKAESSHKHHKISASHKQNINDNQKLETDNQKPDRNH